MYPSLINEERSMEQCQGNVEKIREAVKNQKVVFVLAISFVTIPHVEP